MVECGPQNGGRTEKNRIVSLACEDMGFDDCRVTSPCVNEWLGTYREWLKANYHGGMKYLENHLRFKENPDELLPGVQLAIVLIKNYETGSRLPALRSLFFGLFMCHTFLGAY